MRLNHEVNPINVFRTSLHTIDFGDVRQARHPARIRWLQVRFPEALFLKSRYLTLHLSRPTPHTIPAAAAARPLDVCRKEGNHVERMHACMHMHRWNTHIHAPPGMPPSWLLSHPAPSFSELLHWLTPSLIPQPYTNTLVKLFNRYLHSDPSRNANPDPNPNTSPNHRLAQSAPMASGSPPASPALIRSGICVRGGVYDM